MKPCTEERMRERREESEIVLDVMGLPVGFEAEDQLLLRAAVASYTPWWGRVAGGRGEPQIRLILRRGADDAFPGAPSVHVAGSRLTMEAPGLLGGADAALRKAWCRVPAALAADPERLTTEVVDTLVLFLLTRSGRVPLHAAGVMVGETAVLLAGPSGVGKSTLALAARREGLPVLSDDTVYVQLRPRLRVWGFPRPIHLLPDSVLEEPESGAALRLRGGRWKLAIPARDGRNGAPVAARAVLCLLERGSEAGARALSPEAAVEAITGGLEPGFDHFREEVPAVVSALAAGGAWRLTLSPDASRALAAIRAVAAQRSGAPGRSPV